MKRDVQMEEPSASQEMGRQRARSESAESGYCLDRPRTDRKHRVRDVYVEEQA